MTLSTTAAGLTSSIAVISAAVKEPTAHTQAAKQDSTELFNAVGKQAYTVIHYYNGM